MLHGVLGKQGIEAVGICVQVAGIFQIDGHLRACVAVPPVHALHGADAAHDIGSVKCVQVGLEHTGNLQVPHLDFVINEIGHHLIAGMQLQAVGHGLADGNLVG